MDKDRRILFHLEKDVLPIDEMQTCISEFFSFVQAASDDCLSDLKWYAELERGSVALATYPISETEDAEDVDRCLGAVRKDLQLIRGGKNPETFGQKTMQHYGNITKLFKSNNHIDGNPTITVDTPGDSDRAPIAMVDYQAPTAPALVSHSFGTAYGEVKTLYTAKQPFFALYDETTGKRMKVFYDDALLDQVRRCYRSYARVTGDVTFNPDGTKRDMHACEIQVVDRDKEVSFSDLFGILGDVK